MKNFVINNNVRKTEKESLYVPIHCGIDDNEIIVVIRVLCSSGGFSD